MLSNTIIELNYAGAGWVDTCKLIRPLIRALSISLRFHSQIKRRNTNRTMDALQLFVTSLAVIAIILLMAYFVCHAKTWIRSNREEKIGLSHTKIYNANGYLVRMPSDNTHSQGNYPIRESLTDTVRLRVPAELNGQLQALRFRGPGLQ